MVLQRLAQAFGNALAQFGGVTAVEGDFFDQLLMPALDGAFALAQNLDVAVLVGQHLKFDVARVLDQLLHVHVAAGERRRRFGLRLRQQRAASLPACAPRACRGRRRRPTL